MNLRTIKNYETWLFDPYFDEDTRAELQGIKGNIKEIEERFYKDLEFGTGGMRGIIGAGTNRINKYTIRKATQGLANYIKGQGDKECDRGVVIAYDSRHKSREFCQEAALVLVANGIKAYVFKDLRSTPELSFAVRYLGAVAGIVITASHNPPQYNGYKLYWEDGAQIATKRAKDIIKEIGEIHDFYKCLYIDRDKALKMGLLKYLEDDLDNAYKKAVISQSLRKDFIREVGNEFKIVFTPLHGTGNRPVRQVLEEIGFKHVMVVAQQELPDPNFSTVSYPNPEEKAAFKLAIELAEKEKVDLIIGTDPDCDRVGAVIKDNKGDYMALNGNQIGALLVNYVLSTMEEQKTLPEDGIIIKTIVTSEMGAVIAKKYGVETGNTLTGFKYIGEKIREYEKTQEKSFIFGYEESYGYLLGTYVRDKDAVVTSMLICEMAAYYHSRGSSLYDVLMQLYEEYGYYMEDLESITLEGKEGVEKIQAIMESFRDHPPCIIGDYNVEIVEDYLKQDILPKENVLKFLLDREAWVALRPSGTEPKLKIYCGVAEKTLNKSRIATKSLIASILDRL